jgi:hypothetical protein
MSDLSSPRDTEQPQTLSSEVRNNLSTKINLQRVPNASALSMVFGAGDVAALASEAARQRLLAKLREVTTKDDGVLDGGDSDE